jgi:hypothetical protein
VSNAFSLARAPAGGPLRSSLLVCAPQPPAG